MHGRRHSGRTTFLPNAWLLWARPCRRVGEVGENPRSARLRSHLGVPASRRVKDDMLLAWADGCAKGFLKGKGKGKQQAVYQVGGLGASMCLRGPDTCSTWGCL